ncbi:hypothetical protein FG386_003255 [Cryptosporidium ryanae]|uniref:uncharacterized protein n=1 Tax=Cryptosporidium ryanae TaxID=515981 RepID=UPI00351A7A81|nr:hypothetical protein FG386_003255 [Cryptosporidium ryanae]
MIINRAITFSIKAVFILFLTAVNFKINENEKSSLTLNHVSLIRYNKNAWDIINENYEVHSNTKKIDENPISFSQYKIDLEYDTPFTSQISQLTLVVLIFVVLICTVLSIVCFYYSIPKEEDYVKTESGGIYFENENRPEEYIPLYKKNAEIRRYIATGIYSKLEKNDSQV